MWGEAAVLTASSLASSLKHEMAGLRVCGWRLQRGGEDRERERERERETERGTRPDADSPVSTVKLGRVETIRGVTRCIRSCSPT